MATYTGTAAQAGIQPKGLRVGLVAVKSTYSFNTSSASVGTTLQMVKVPAGATPIFVQYGSKSTADFTVSIGSPDLQGLYRSAATLSAGLGMIVSNIVQAPYTFSKDDYINAYISLASVATLGGAFYMNVIFSMDAT